MDLLPQVKCFKKENTNIRINHIQWDFEQCEDIRVRAAALRIAENCQGGFCIKVCHGNSTEEAYRIKIAQEAIVISSDGAAGAFYALQTLSQILESEIPCGEITDYPDMRHRGFYHDITRGKIPKLETLKKLVDRLALLKMNSLQLYVEHAFECKVYEFCRERLGCITKAELVELDQYCYDRFIDFIPSLACFGHLYHLLQDGPYKHLAEIADFEPYLDYFLERHKHHTINPLKEESFEIVKALLDEYIPLFRSEYFNICCDETFDLGKGVNRDQKAEDLYFGFVTRIIKYVKSKGKKIMMWSDVLANHPNSVDKLPDDIIFLSWAYTDKPPMERFTVPYRYNRLQIVCPGTTSWAHFTEDVEVEETNIALLAGFVTDYHALGLLNTNWGDAGNLATIPLAYYGMTCGAALAWNVSTKLNGDFRKAVSEKFYGYEGAVDLLAELSPIRFLASWYEARYLISAYSTAPDSQYYEKARYDVEAILNRTRPAEEYQGWLEKCADLYDRVKKLQSMDFQIRRDLLIAIQGYALLLKWNAQLRGLSVECWVDFDRWKNDFTNEWYLHNKRGELEEILRIFHLAENGHMLIHDFV